MVEDYECSMKILVLGNGMVGKTSMTQRFAKDLFTGQYKKTLGVDFLLKQKYIKSIDKDVEFMIWDTAGQEAYDAITSRYYKGASAALIVFSVTDRDSFVAVKKWYNKIRQECDSIPINLIMNKVDLVEKGVVAEKEAIELANEMKVPMYKVSVKENSMVNEAFESLAVEYFKKGLNVNNNPIDDVKNLGKKNSVDKKDNTQEIRVVDKIGDGFSLKKKNTESKTEKKKSKSFCSIL